MKTRIGFVSNSSSSSFVLIGTDDKELVEKLYEAEKKLLGERAFTDAGCGMVEGKYFTFARPKGYDEDGDGYSGFYSAGLGDVEEALEGKSLKQLRPKVVALVRELAKKSGVEIDVREKDIKLLSGESHSEC